MDGQIEVKNSSSTGYLSRASRQYLFIGSGFEKVNSLASPFTSLAGVFDFFSEPGASVICLKNSVPAF